MEMTAQDRATLALAVARLEHQNFAINLANRVGVPLENLMNRLPRGADALIARAVNKALEQCLDVALKGLPSQPSARPWNRTHKLLTGATGATGGFFGLPGLFVELPVSTTLILHSIAEIARSYGEDLTQPEGALACLEVLALGREHGRPEPVESAYYATRAGLAQATREAAAYLSEKGLAKGTAPALVRFLSRIAARFGIDVTEKAAAQLVPIAGALGGMALNVMFTAHFQALAQGHFAVRRLERLYGPDAVRREYSRLSAGYREPPTSAAPAPA
jgi:hypothetical protein